jgi:O-antigen/teichoic acid export membrane protein
MAVTLIPSVFGAVLLPTIAEQFGKGDMEKVRRIYLTSARYLMMLAIPLAAGGIALSRPIINLLYGPAYAPAVILMQIVFVPFAAASIGNAAASVILGINQPSFVLKVGSLLALLNVGLNLWLIPRYGMLGAAMASSVPRILALPIYIIFASRKIRAAWPLVDTIKISAASCFMGLTLFALQTHLSAALGVILGIPLGVVLYAIAILVFKVLHSQDLNILKGIQDSLPLALRKHYAVFIELAGRLVIAKPAKSDSDLG